jgi:hypothetical protein
MGEATFDLDGNGLGHFVGNDLAEAFFAIAASGTRGGGRGGCCG